METKKEILKKVCNYKEDEEIMANDDITIEEAIEAMEQYAKEYHESKVKNLNIPAVIKPFCVCPHGFKKKNYDECAICGGKWKGRPKQNVV